MTRRLAVLALLAYAAAGPAFAEEIVSGQAEGLSATLYQPPENSGLAPVALITETRRLSLPKGSALVRFDGVASGLVPQTAHLDGLKGDIRESIFSYGLFNTASVLRASLGQPVTVVRTPPKGGEERVEGTLVSDQGLYSLKSGDGIEAIGCGTIPARLELPIPNGLRAVPALSMSLQSPGGEQNVRLSYLTEGLDWKAAYVARLAKDGRHMTLEGRMVVTNNSDASFHDLPVRFVAGDIERREETRAPGRMYRPDRRDCWELNEQIFYKSMSAGKATAAPMMAKVVPGSARYFIAEEPERLGDLKLYRMPHPITIAAHQTKLFTFLPPRRVTVTPVYRVDLVMGTDQPAPAQLVWRLRNRKVEGLGMALPHGAMTFYGADGSYLGEDKRFRDLPAEGEAKLVGPPDSSLVFEMKPLEVRDGMLRIFALTLRNQTAQPLPAEIAFPYNLTPRAPPKGVTVKDGLWLLTLPPGKTRQMIITVDKK